MICEQIKLISEDSSDFIKNFRQRAKKAGGQPGRIRPAVKRSQKMELQENEQQIANLVDILAKTPNTPAFDYITEQINTLQREKRENQESN